MSESQQTTRDIVIEIRTNVATATKQIDGLWDKNYEARDEISNTNQRVAKTEARLDAVEKFDERIVTAETKADSIIDGDKSAARKAGKWAGGLTGLGGGAAGAGGLGILVWLISKFEEIMVFLRGLGN